MSVEHEIKSGKWEGFCRGKASAVPENNCYFLDRGGFGGRLRL